MKTIVKILFMLCCLQQAKAQSNVVDSLKALLPALKDGQQKVDVLGQLVKQSLNSDLEASKRYAHQMVSLSRKIGNELAAAGGLKDLAAIHLIASKYDSSKHFCLLAIRAFEQLSKKPGKYDKAKLWEGYAGSYGNLGNWFYYQAQLDSAIFYHEKAIGISEKSGKEKVKANSLGTLSFIYLDQSKFDKAMEMQLEVLHSFERQGDKDGISRAYQGIAEINCEYLDKCKLALDYYYKSLKIKREIGSDRGLAYVMRKLGNTHETISNLDSAEYYFKETVRLAEKLGDKRLMVDGYSALAALWTRMNKPDSQLIRINLKVIALGKETKYQEGQYGSYYNIGEVYRKKGDYRKAAEYYDQAAVLGDVSGDYDFLSKLNFARYTIYKEHLQDAPKALAALEAYLVSHDSVTNAAKFKAVEDISTQYETAKKEVIIAEQKEAIHQGRIRFWLIVGILGLALVGGGLLFRLTRQLRKRNEEKEYLIKEIHHRVKNNLQVLSSLLHLQSRHIKDDAALDAVREGQNRVEAMGLIHQKLYMGDRLAAVEMKDYLKNLGDTLLDSFGLDDRVNISYQLEPLHLDVDTAIPLGLIINELVTNSLKYAFPDGRKGMIEISLWKEAGQLCLKVADDGVGKAGAPQLKGSTSFGTNLVEILSKKLKGVPESVMGEGYATLIKFANFKEV
jgi:two-component sensor histidine kinase